MAFGASAFRGASGFRALTQSSKPEPASAITNLSCPPLFLTTDEGNRNSAVILKQIAHGQRVQAAMGLAVWYPSANQRSKITIHAKQCDMNLRI